MKCEYYAIPLPTKEVANEVSDHLFGLQIRGASASPSRTGPTQLAAPGFFDTQSILLMQQLLFFSTI